MSEPTTIAMGQEPRVRGAPLELAGIRVAAEKTGPRIRITPTTNRLGIDGQLVDRRDDQAERKRIHEVPP